MLRYIILLTGLALILAVATGCDNRGTGIEPLDLGDLAQDAGVDHSFDHPFTPDLTLQPKNQQELLHGASVWPPTAVDARYPMPMLILLAPEGGDEFYYFNAGLAELYRELIAAELIQPMLVFCLANDQVFGGYFYGNSDAAGKYDSIFHYEKAPAGEEPDNLLDVLHWRYPATIELATKRGIGGVGQGAYGAFRVAIKNPDLFTSISVTDGPLDFDGATGSGGLINLFDNALAEQHAFYALNPKLDGDDAALPFNFRRDFDSSYTMPISQMLIGGAFAFSPNDSVEYFRRVDTTYVPNTDIILSTTMRLTNVVQYRISDTLTDSSTFIDDMMIATPRTRNLDLDFHLPFDGYLTRNDAIWDLWMRNNLEDMHTAALGDPLTGVSMWFGTNRSSRWGYYDMTQSWIDHLQPIYPSMIQIHEYSSAAGDPDIGDENLYDILRRMLIFHSNNFGD